LLKQKGFHVIEAATGRECLAMIDRHKPSVVLLDVNLPDMSGFDVCRRIRSDPQTAAITILHISASSVMAQHQAHGLDSGADGYIVEPVEPAVLIATVNAFLRARHAEEALRKSAEELRWFSYRVGHDLDEPLRTITAYAQLLKIRLRRDEDPETATLLDFIAGGALRIRSFMDSLLQYLRASHEETESGPVDTEAVLSRVVANLASAIADSGAVVTHDALPTIQADQRLEHVFQNLLSNAIKYRRLGVIPTVHVSAILKTPEWVFSVRDNGVGIEPQFAEGIFEIFRRLHGRDIAGHGIGLALAKRVVEAQAGRMWVESEPGTGSTFYFTVPVRTTDVPC
jgi:light-regulated signal transduction histidine kinase (bacteriophytochrome)